MPDIVSEIKRNYSRIFRRLYIKRKSATTGLFESDWVNITNDVKSFGKIRRDIDNVRYANIKFSDMMVKVQNLEGRYNPNDDESSLWFGYASQQRTLVKVECGFIHQTLGVDGIWINTEYPTNPAVYHGIISGDINISDRNEVVLPVKPLLQVFREFPARNLTGFTSSGMTASQFMTMLRDQTDGSSNYIFRPFFQDTTTYWDIAATTNVYSNLNTSTAVDVYDANVWDIVEKLASTEDVIVYIKNDGTLKFGPRLTPTTGAAFEFIGVGFKDNNYGQTIKKISRYGKKQSDYYSRVEVKWIDSNTVTAVRVKESSFTVTGNNDPWNLGHRTYRFENFWIPTVTVADTILNNIFSNVTSLKNQIEFTSTLVPHLEVLDRISLSYDSTDFNANSIWDFANWSYDDTDTADDFYWDKTEGDAIRLVGAEFKILSVSLDLDKLESMISGLSV